VSTASSWRRSRTSLYQATVCSTDTKSAINPKTAPAAFNDRRRIRFTNAEISAKDRWRNFLAKSSNADRRVLVSC